MDNLEPRQIEFLKNYLDPKSETYSDAMNSAIKSGYTREYAENITHLMPNWLSEAIGRRKRMLEKAEKRLEASIDSADEKIAQDTSKFIAKTIGREHYSEKQEVDIPSKGEKIATLALALVKEFEEKLKEQIMK